MVSLAVFSLISLTNCSRIEEIEMSYTVPKRPKGRPYVSSSKDALVKTPRDQTGLASKVKQDSSNSTSEKSEPDERTGLQKFFDFFQGSGGELAEQSQRSPSDIASTYYTDDFTGRAADSRENRAADSRENRAEDRAITPVETPPPSWLRNPFADLFSDVEAFSEPPSVIRNTLLPEGFQGMAAPEKNRDKQSNRNIGDGDPLGTGEIIEVADVPVETETPTGTGLMSPRLDSKPRETNQYEQMLYSGNATDRIKGIQGSLSRLGYVPRGIDGAAGAGTSSALRHFQRANNLEVTGVADEATMSSLKAAESPTPFSFSEATEGLHANYVVDGIEGAGHHLGGADYRDVGITLEAGIVPDSGLKYEHNGTVIDLPNNTAQRWPVLSAAGVTRRNFNEDNVITDDVVKSGIRRSDYSSDEDFTKAVITGFQDRAEDAWVEVGYSREDFSTDARKTLTDLAWNAGVETIGYNSMRPVLAELAKDVEDRDITVMQGLLNTAPTQGGRILGGVMKRRAIQYNWSVPEEDRIVSVTSSSRTGQGVYTYENGDTYTISRTRGADTQNVRVPRL
ncbi:peptidoglycan-binding protein [bacterium]|nr:peptidoglycan-binding protein [bacterium]